MTKTRKQQQEQQEQQEQQQQEKTIRPPQKSQKMSLCLREVVLTPYDEIESCREWRVESSHMCKNSSRRTPRPKNSSKPKISKMTMKMVKNDYENGQKWLWKWSKMTMKMIKNDYENRRK